MKDEFKEDLIFGLKTIAMLAIGYSVIMIGFVHLLDMVG